MTEPKSSLEVTDAESAAVAVAPRVTLASMEAKIAEKHEFTMGEALMGLEVPHDMMAFGILSVCVLKMQNGFTVIGKAAPASAANFNRELGRKFAYEDAIRHIWPLVGNGLRVALAVQEAQLRVG